MNAFIIWGDALELGIPSVDRQHQELIDLLNRLTALSGSSNTGAEAHDDLLELLGHLYQHTVVHFHHEEELMEAIGYADLFAHRDEHQMLLAELRSFVHQIESGDTTLDAKSVHALRDWLLVHVTSSDRPFAATYHQAMAPEKSVTSR